MNRATPALLALLLVCSLPAMTVVAAGPGTGDDGGDNADRVTLQQPAAQQLPPAELEGTTNRLELTGEIRSSHITHRTDLGAALATTDDALRIDQEQYVLLDREFTTATAEEREQMIQTAYNQIENRTEALETRERESVRAHANGELSDAELRQMLLRNTREAEVLSDALEDLSDRADRVGYTLLVRNLQTELEMYQTDIRTELEATTLGFDRNTATVAIQTSVNGYTISTVDSNYVRETIRFDNRDTENENQFTNMTDALRSAEEKYPRVFDTGQSSRVARGVKLYQIHAPHDSGHLETYLDGGTGDVYREVQELDPAALPTVGNKTWQGKGLGLSIEETVANGPAKVTVTDTLGNEPKAATITIDGVEVGETDAEDGTLWIVPPVGEYELAAASEDGNVDATVSGYRVTSS